MADPAESSSAADGHVHQPGSQSAKGKAPLTNGAGGQTHENESTLPNGSITNGADGQAVPPAQQPAQPDGAETTSTPNGDVKPAKKQRTFGLPLRALTKKGPPGGYDDTPLPDAPQGYTVRFVFEYAVNLPPSDFHTASSDPFLTATLKASNLKRHKEDPDLFFRTRTLRKTTSPEWKSEWVVANVPPTGFQLKCRMYDEDYPDSNDRLGNVTLKIPHIDDSWEGFPSPGREFEAKKRMISKRAFFLKGVSSVLSHNFHMTPRLCISIEILGKSDPPYAQMCTVAPTFWFKHFSPMIGRLTGTKVNADESYDAAAGGHAGSEDRRTQKYDFQANEMQLHGPVPSRLYHRYVEFRPIISSMFMSKGLRGKILNSALHKQHARVYNFDRSTEYGTFEPCSEEAALQFLRLAHFDEGGRLFTYVLTLDGLLRFTETGHEFGIDLLSKHTMHSDVATYIACSGEFFIRRLQHPDASDDPNPNEKTHPNEPIPGGPPKHAPPPNPSYYQLIIDNDSGTYRPDKRVLPDLKKFLEANFPGLGIVTMHCDDDELKKLKENQLKVKKQEGRMINVVMNRSQSSISSAESDLEDRDATWEQGQPSKREAAYAALEDPKKMKDAVRGYVPGMKAGESSKQEAKAAA